MTDSAAFKDKINADTVATLASRFGEVLPGFDVAGFTDAALYDLNNLPLKARLKHIARAVRDAWSGPLPVLIDALPRAAALTPVLRGFSAWPLLQVVEDHGLPARQESLAALPQLTCHWSAEFAIRPFLRADPTGTLAELRTWATHPEPAVRRLVSEGSRPRLPWGARLRRFDADPDHTLPLLELLRADPAETVRRSVANHLNDLSKQHPDRVVAVLSRWQREVPTPEMAWIVRHGARSLIKQGHRGGLALRGFAPPALVVEQFSVTPTPLDFGEPLTLSTRLRATQHGPNATPTAQRWAVDFVIHHVKASGQAKAKVFKWREVRAAPGAVLELAKTHSIRAISTRRYYAGRHRVTLQVNGQTVAEAEFELRMPPES